MNDMEKRVEKEYRIKIRNFLDRLSPAMISDSIPLKAEVHKSVNPIPLKEAVRLKRKPIEEGETWGKVWESGYFRLTGTVPGGWKGSVAAAQLDFTGEALVYSKEGVPLYGLTAYSALVPNYTKEIYRLLEPCKGGEGVELFVEAAANALFGVTRYPDAAPDDPDRHGTFPAEFKKARLVRFNEEVRALRLDMTLLLDLAEALPEDSVRRARIVRGLNRAANDYGESPERAGKVRAGLKPLLMARNGSTALASVSVGHAHIDTAWLWRVRESMRKVARTFASQIANLERYPSYVFGASQAQLYAFARDHYPELYAKVKKAVKEGRWEVQGGMWVEADCNLISGESMVRQFLHGKNFFRDEFGAEVRSLWLPDVFGYSANLPQIMKKSGVDFFLTQKLSWCQFNDFPHQTFIWRGIDGSEVVTHFPPENTYNSNHTAAGLAKAASNFKEKGLLDEFMTLFGVGDGGGGPKEDHIENALRMADLEGLPKTVLGRSDAFFERLEKRKSELDVFSGELYLEFHRGTLTTQARIKRDNRLLENRLRAAEALLSLVPAADYPSADLDRIWKKMLTSQFHDIIPGSSIHAVYEDARREYEEAFSGLEKLVHDGARKAFKAKSGSLILFNAAGVPCTASVELPESWNGSAVARADGRPVASQSENGRVVVRTSVEPYGYATLLKKGDKPLAAFAGGKELVLENKRVRYSFSKEGRLIEALDKESGKTVVAEGGEGNLLSLYVDRPNKWDAWDVDFHYPEQKLEDARCVSAKLIFSGPLRSALALEFTAGKSAIRQTVLLDADSKTLIFKTRVEWREVHHMLRVAFPVNVRAERAAFDIQYGFVKRSTHTNTSWDFARFEAAGHRYADLSDGDYGVALLNDCKYGYRVRGNVLDLNLLRSPREPDPDADLGAHEFTYALCPHAGGLIESEVMAEAEQLNMPPLVLEGVAGDGRLPLRVEGRGVMLAVLKKAEKEECLVARLVETLGRTSEARLIANGMTLVETDLLEWSDGARLRVDGEAKITLAPFEIRTYKIKS